MKIMKTYMEGEAVKRIDDGATPQQMIQLHILRQNQARIRERAAYVDADLRIL
jgi:hypothetical protein